MNLENVRNKTWDSVYDSVYYSVRDSVRVSVRDSEWSSVTYQMRRTLNES